MRILCYGDSNTYGYDPRGFFGSRYGAEDRWVDLLAKLTGAECINAGVNGSQIPRNTYSSSLPSADLLIVVLGTNDLLQGVSPKETALRMERFLNHLLPCYPQILLAAPPPMRRGAWVATDELVEKSVALTEEYKLLAQKLNIPFADTRNWNIELAFDGVHFTEAGHHTFAAQLIKFLK